MPLYSAYNTSIIISLPFIFDRHIKTRETGRSDPQSSGLATGSGVRKPALQLSRKDVGR
jgi:hypothetical protein